MVKQHSAAVKYQLRRSLFCGGEPGGRRQISLRQRFRLILVLGTTIVEVFLPTTTCRPPVFLTTKTSLLFGRRGVTERKRTRSMHADSDLSRRSLLAVLVILALVPAATAEGNDTTLPWYVEKVNVKHEADQEE